MFTELNDFSEDDLLFIANCKKWKNLQKRFNQEQINLLFRISNSHIPHNEFSKPNNNVFDQALLSAGDVLSNPVYILYYLCGIFSAYAFSILCIALVPVGLGLSLFYFYSTYKEEERNSQKQEALYQFIFLKLSSANELLERHGTVSLNLPEHSTELIIEKVNRKRLSAIKTSLSTIVGVGTALFSAYYSLGFILGSCGASIAVGMLTALPLSIVVLGGLGVGLYFGYKYYQTSQNATFIKKSQKLMLENLEEKIGEHTVLVDLLKQQQQNFIREKFKVKVNNHPSKAPSKSKKRVLLQNYHGYSVLRSTFFKKARIKKNKISRDLGMSQELGSFSSKICRE